MQHINPRNQDDGDHEEQQPVSKNEISCKHAEFCNLGKPLTGRLCDGVPAHGVPFTSPEGDVGTLALELSRQEQRNNELEQESLHANDCNHAGHGTGKVEALEQKQHLKEDQHEDDCKGVCNSGQDTAKFLAAHAQ